MTIEIHGTNAYGYLKSERGPHRLIRFSPFNAKNSRETSFASVGVIPDVEDDVDIEVREEDLQGGYLPREQRRRAARRIKRNRPSASPTCPPASW